MKDATFSTAALSAALVLIAVAGHAPVRAEPPDDSPWARVSEDDRSIKIETDKLEAVIPKKDPKHWMTGIEKGSFLDKTTGFREIGDGLMVIDWLMEAGSDEAWAERVIAPDGHGVGRYTWYENETDPQRRQYALMAHGSSHRKRVVEGPQLCHRMKPVEPEVIRGEDFVAVKTTYKYEYAAPGREAGSRWTQLIVFPKGQRYFVLMDRIDSVNDSQEMFLRNDTPGCVRHTQGDTFSEIYLSYLDGPQGVRIPSSEFFTPFPPDLKYGYRRDTHRTPKHFIRAYHLRDKETGKDGPWLAGLTLEPSVVYEAWCSQRPGDIIVMIEEIHGRPVRAGESFSAAHIVGYFDTIQDMHAVYDRYKGHTALAADATGWRLEKPAADRARTTKISVTIDRGRDLGQNFGSLFEANSDDAALVIGAGFQNLYNTRYRADRHAVQFYVRPTSGQRTFTTETLPRPNHLCGTYLYGRDGVVRSTYGAVKTWDPAGETWQAATSIGGTEETMRVGQGLVEFGDSTVRYNGRTILDPPSQGSYQLFFYANGHLCFYHVNRGEGGYRPYTSDAEGFSKLYACPWSPERAAVDLSQAVVLTLPVVGETTFAWGQLGRQIVTGSNVGGFYVFEDGTWNMLLEPQLGVSYQLYSTVAFRDRLLMGQYPTGRLFEYDGQKISELAGWPPKLEGVSGSAREAQTTVVYGGDVLVGVWPWGELWRYNPDSDNWIFVRRMFDHPDPSDKFTHPYDAENRGNAVGNLWGQRVTSLVTSGPDLFISTSAKTPCQWDAETFPFLAPEKWKSYGTVYRLTMPGHLGATTGWTDGPTTFEFTIRGAEIAITQDGRQLAATRLAGPLAERLRDVSGLGSVQWGHGIYGPFSGAALEGTVSGR